MLKKRNQQLNYQSPILVCIDKHETELNIVKPFF